ncbi:MAG: hypothetical protein P4L43_05545 [Syntrophobacteraceae bacterium]|nr:hypothetical protein [Syntrophobacteraceae bacterium]
MVKTHEPATVRNALELLCRIINFGADKQLSPKLGFTIEMPEVDNVTTEDLPSDQLSRLLEEIESTPHVPGREPDENGLVYRHEARGTLPAGSGPTGILSAVSSVSATPRAAKAKAFP